jgi:DNA-binding beta-propeller fold protein YncE
MKLRRGGAVGSLVLLGVLASPTSNARAGDRQVVWVSVENADRTVKVDVGARDVLRSFRTPGGPHNVTVAPDGTVVAALYGAQHIAIIRGGTVDRVFLGGRPHDVKIAGRRVVVANEGSSRIQLVRFDGRLMRRILLRHPPHDLAVAPNEHRAWVTMNGTGNLAVVNLDRRAPVRYVRTGQRPHDILFGPDGNLWVTDWNGELHVFAVPRGRLRKTIHFGVESHHLAFTPDGRFVWITDHSARKVFIVRVRTVHVVDRIRFPGEPHHVAITQNGRWAVVADHANGRLVIYNAATHRRVGRIRVGAGPHGVWASG